jgi:2-oxoglutarate ferredoxin oxidoreductase subunit alpha
MGVIDIEAKAMAQTSGTGDPIINDFAMMVATKNGSGSQTSNNLLVNALFRMGIPVNGKNLFPSNIKGLPTWYTIRVSKDGYTARRATTEVAVAYNQDTAAEDIRNLPAGGVCILPSDWKWTKSREDIVYYEIPVKDLMKQADVASDLRERVTNMTYVGVMARLIDIPLDVLWRSLLDNFKGKEKPARLNMNVIELAHAWAVESLEKRDRFYVQPMDKNEGKIVITGNEAGAIGALFGGLTVASWYPITPSTSLIDAVLSYKNIRKDPETGRDTVAVVQAEDEIAAIGMIVGAGWAGARAMTATSGPGISLMAEFTGLAYYAEIPCVIWDVTRMGPSTGLPTRTSQGDLLFAHFLGHGDCRQVCLLPGSVEECFEFGWRAFDLAEELQTPVFVLSDLDLGMNNWMAEPFQYPDEPIKRGKVLDEKKLDEFIEKYGKWGRYWDVDGDGVPYRTLPGIDHAMGSYFARGTGHNEMAVYSERADDWLHNMKRLALKMETARRIAPQPVIDDDAASKVGIISFGSNDSAIQEARDHLAAEGAPANYLRVRALPLAESVLDFVFRHETIYVIENNFDGQLFQLIKMDTQADTRHVHSLALGDSLPMTADWILNTIATLKTKERN